MASKSRISSVLLNGFNPIIKTFYEGLLKKGKPKKLAILASSRKLLVAIIGMIRSYKLQLKETY